MLAVDPWSAPPEHVRARRVRWGLPDVALAWLAGLVAAVVFGAFAIAADPHVLDGKGTPAWYLVGALVVQNGVIVGALAFIANRKGRGSLDRDFGFRWPLERLSPRAFGAWIGAGALGSIAASLLLRPIADLAHLDESAQEVSKTVERASGAGVVLLFLGIVVVAPVAEELLFRGALLRALQRRFSVPVAVFASATVFAGIHVLGDPGSYYVVPGLLLLGLVSGAQAVRTGDLSRSIALHMGFNVLSAIFLVANR
jgi:membrane protease YdiL (CAAX protease family)